MAITLEHVPPYLVGSLIRKRGEQEAALWLKHALILVETLSERWSFEPVRTLSGGTKSLCIAGRRESREAVLKISPIQQMGYHEVEALSVWGEEVGPRVIAVDRETSSFLMEHLDAVDEKPQARDVLQLTRALNIVGSTHSEMPMLEANISLRLEWAQRRFKSQPESHSVAEFDEAQGIISELLNTVPQRGLIHGDFQTKNLINTSSGLRAIDPMPCIGDPLFDLALWLVGSSERNPVSESLAILGEDMSTCEYDRFLLWCYSLSVLEDVPVICHP